MKKLIVSVLVSLITVSASATDWLYVDTDKLGVDNYIDAHSIRVVDQNAQIVTAFIKMSGIEKSKLKIENKTINSSSIKFSYDCRNENSKSLSSIFYDTNGAVIHSDNNAGQFNPIHPGTSHYLNMYAACAIAGFKDISNLL